MADSNNFDEATNKGVDNDNTCDQLSERLRYIRKGDFSTDSSTRDAYRDDTHDSEDEESSSQFSREFSLKNIHAVPKDQIEKYITSSDQESSSINGTSNHYKKQFRPAWLRSISKYETKIIFNFFDVKSSLLWFKNWGCCIDKYQDYIASGVIALPYMSSETLIMFEKKFNSEYISQPTLSMAHLLAMLDIGIILAQKNKDEAEKITECTRHEGDLTISKMAKLCISGKFSKFKLEKINCMKVKAIRQNEANFLCKALSLLKPSYPCEPFYDFGIELICLKDMKQLYTFEDTYIPEDFVNIEDVELSPNQIEVLDLLCGLLTPETFTNQDNRHFLYILLSKIVDHDGKYTTFWRQQIPKQAKNPLLKEVMNFLHNYIKKEALLIGNFRQIDIAEFIMAIFNDSTFTCKNGKSMTCRTGKKRNITQFKVALENANTQNQYIMPSLEIDEYYETEIEDYCLTENVATQFVKVIRVLISEITTSYGSNFETWKPPMKNIYYESNDVSASHINSELLWQLCEELLASLLNSKYKPCDKKVVLQGGILVCNDKIRTVVLATSTRCYSALVEKKCARDTVSWIKSRKMWARLYIEAEENHILDFIKQAKYAFANFCKCI